MKKYTGMFELQDKMRSSKASREIIEKRQALMKEFIEFRTSVKEKFVKEKQERIKLRGTLSLSIQMFKVKIVHLRNIQLHILLFYNIDWYSESSS